TPAARISSCNSHDGQFTFESAHARKPRGEHLDRVNSGRYVAYWAQGREPERPQVAWRRQRIDPVFPDSVGRVPTAELRDQKQRQASHRRNLDSDSGVGRQDSLSVADNGL